ncbi:hypothetical protein Psuf_031620 [Phytohabitans suffuscus]|uniref:Pentapeptide repeat-containing protein n=2 Tax=Phytohabitans suffuscus TaxID=624315 RepID=A0A6F8YIK8_9ACTN|nr:hypothetical protein Psuf_031620 [Phytohabitans suffuscus]
MQCARIEEQANFDNITVRNSATLDGLECNAFFQFVNGSVGGSLSFKYAKLAGIWTTHTVVQGNLDMSNADLHRKAVEAAGALARFDGTTIEGDATFTATKFPFETTFGGYADMNAAKFNGRVDFSESQFGTPEAGGRHLLQQLDLAKTSFNNCVFHGRVSFAGSVFAQRPDLSNIRVHSGPAHQPAAKDQNDARFPESNLDLSNVRLPQGATLRNIDVVGSMTISFSDLAGELEVSGIRVSDRLLITNTTFQYLPFDAKAGTIAIVRCQFAKGGVVGTSTNSLQIIESDARQPVSIVAEDGAERTFLTSLSRTNLENFTFVGLDFSRTSLTGSVNLEKIRIQGQFRFLRSPRFFGTGREAIFDEAVFRASRRIGWRWRRHASTNASRHDNPQAVAGSYRALRKNREDSKDEPGGADFYYGEMEMRRIAARTLSAEWGLLTAYWLISGYGLRAWRAVSALTLFVFAGGLALEAYGFRSTSPGGMDSALLFAQTSIGLARLPDNLTSAGSFLFIAGRIACPALLALAALAVRGRLKR